MTVTEIWLARDRGRSFLTMGFPNYRIWVGWPCIWENRAVKKLIVIEFLSKSSNLLSINTITINNKLKTTVENGYFVKKGLLMKSVNILAKKIVGQARIYGARISGIYPKPLKKSAIIQFYHNFQVKRGEKLLDDEISPPPKCVTKSPPGWGQAKIRE